MFAEKIIDRLPIRSAFTKLLIGSSTTALIISLGMVYISSLFGFDLGPALPSAFAAIGAAIYASKVKSR